jgi:hypothetical protein
VGSLQDQLQKLQQDLQICQAGTSQAGSSINSTTFCGFLKTIKPGLGSINRFSRSE